MLDLAMTLREYLAFNAWGSTSLRQLAAGETPAHVHARRWKPEETKSMRMGTCLHALIEREVSGAPLPIYVCQHDGRTVAGKEERKLAAVNEHLIVSAGEMEAAEGMFASMMASEFLKGFIHAAQSEVTVIWEETVPTPEIPAPSLRFRTRVDLFDSKNGLVGEIKTSHPQVSPRRFGRTVGFERYDVQMYHHIRGLGTSGYKNLAPLMIAVENDPPYLCACYWLDPKVIERAREDWMNAARMLAVAKQQDRYFGYSEAPLVLTPELVPVYS